MTSSWLPWALGSAAFAALTALFGKIGLDGIDSDFATLLRTVVIIAVLGLFVGLAGKWRNPLELPPRSLLFLALSAVATGASWVCYYRALKVGEAFKVSTIDRLSVVLVAALGIAFLGERPNVREWTGILLVTAGLVVFSFKR